MDKLPKVSGKEMVNFLLKQGFVIKRQRGSHVTLYKQKEGKGFYATVPVHANKELLPKTFQSILRQAGMTRGEFIELFKN